MDTAATRIKIDGKTLLVFRDRDRVVEGRTSSGGFDVVLRRLLIQEVDGSKMVGCVVFYLGILAAYSWDSEEDTIYGKEEKRELAFANLLPHIPLGFDHLKNTYGHSSTCLSCFFDKDNDGFQDDKTTYYIKLENSFIKTAQRLMFPKGLNKKVIEFEILQILLNSLEENPTTFMSIDDLKASIPLTTKSLFFHLDLLKEEDKIDFVTSPHSDPPKIISVKIKSKGIRYLDGDSGNVVQSPQMVKNVYGTNIENLTTHGDNSPINITFNDINAAIGEIIKQVEEKEFQDKKEVLQSVTELQKELGGRQEPSKVRTHMENIKQKAAWVYNLIFKNPVLTAFLTQLLLKTIKP